MNVPDSSDEDGQDSENEQGFYGEDGNWYKRTHGNQQTKEDHILGVFAQSGSYNNRRYNNNNINKQSKNKHTNLYQSSFSLNSHSQSLNSKSSLGMNFVSGGIQTVKDENDNDKKPNNNSNNSNSNSQQETSSSFIKLPSRDNPIIINADSNDDDNNNTNMSNASTIMQEYQELQEEQRRMRQNPKKYRIKQRMTAHDLPTSFGSSRKNNQRSKSRSKSKSKSNAQTHGQSMFNMFGGVGIAGGGGLGYNNSQFSRSSNILTDTMESGKNKINNNRKTPQQQRGTQNSNGSNGSNTSNATFVPVMEVNKNYGKWQEHTSGFGLKMLQKFGFRGRLGKDEQGIAEPVQVRQRKQGMYSVCVQFLKG